MINSLFPSELHQTMLKICHGENDGRGFGIKVNNQGKLHRIVRINISILSIGDPR